MANNVKMRITLDKAESGRPVLKLSFKNETDEERFLRQDLVLTPFRKYCFQITDAGCCDYGSTRAIPFETFKSLPNDAKAEMLRCAAATVLYEYSTAHHYVPAFSTRECWGGSVFMDFIKATFEYLYPQEKWPFLE